MWLATVTYGALLVNRSNLKFRLTVQQAVFMADQEMRFPGALIKDQFGRPRVHGQIEDYVCRV